MKRIKYIKTVTEIDDYLLLYEMFNDEEYIQRAEHLDDNLEEEIHTAIKKFIGSKKYLTLTNLFDRNEKEPICNTVFHVTNPEVATYEIMNIIGKMGLLIVIEAGENGINFIFEDNMSLMLFDYTKGVIEC